MKLPLISVVIPSYNKGLYIKETLESIFNQSYKNFEVIIVDGGSTDVSVDVIKKFASKYKKNIFWESKKDKGQLDAINRGLSKAKGEIVTFMNADDFYTKDAFKIVSDHFVKYPRKNWFAGRSYVVNSRGKEIFKFITLYKNFLLMLNSWNFLLITNYLMQPSVFLTREAYKRYGPFTGTNKFVMEYDLWLILGRLEMPHIINHTLSAFRLSSENKTKIMTEEILRNDFDVVGKYTNNSIILFLHKLHNFVRIFIGKFI